MKTRLLIVVSCIVTTTLSAQLRNVSGGGGSSNPENPLSNLKKKNSRQSLKDIPFRIDTLHYHDESILKQRYLPQDLNAVYGDNTSENIVSTKLRELQDQLDDMNSYILYGSNIDFIKAGETLLDAIKNARADFDYSNYQREYDFYVRINKERAEAKAEKVKADWQKAEKEREQYVIEATAREKERTRIKDSVDDAKEQEEKYHAAMNEIKAAQEKRALEKELTKKYGSTNAKAIVNGSVLLGMTKEMCYIAWGQPYTINKSTSKGIITEKWVYNTLQFLVFKNGRVTMINE